MSRSVAVKGEDGGCRGAESTEEEEGRMAATTEAENQEKAERSARIRSRRDEDEEEEEDEDKDSMLFGGGPLAITVRRAVTSSTDWTLSPAAAVHQ